MRRLAAAILGCVIAAPCSPGAVYYLSPQGRDGANGRSGDTAWKTFSKAFSKMRAGDELVLLDGTYSEAAGTGYINYEGRHSGQIPSGSGPAAPTVVRAQNPGRVYILGGLFLGRSSRKNSHIVVRGITFTGPSVLFNTSYITLKDCGFHDESNGGGAVLTVGTNDHAEGNDHNLIEDCWVWGRNRAMAINYRAQYNVWRRVVIRGDGCNSGSCTGSGNPNVGISVYDSAHISLQNVIVVDRVLGGGTEYADFAVAQHSPGVPFGDNEWLGTLSLHSPDIGYYFEPDEASLVPAHRFRNCIAWDSKIAGINLARAGVSDIRNCTVKSYGYAAVRVVSGGGAGALENLVVLGEAQHGVISAVEPRNVVLSGQWSEAAYTREKCRTGCRSDDPIANGSIRYLTRIEPGSPLRRGAASEAGAQVVYRYGGDGSRYGEPGYNTLSNVPLWPWPNEARIQAEMCRASGVARGFCAKRSLTEYIWTYLGHPVPPEFSAGQ